MGWIIWDPSSVFFMIPYLGLPLTWYGLIFASGFLIGYQIFIYMFCRYLAFSPSLRESDVNWKEINKLPFAVEKGNILTLKKIIDKEPLSQKTLTRWQQRLLRETERKRGSLTCEMLRKRFLWENAVPKFFRPLKDRAVSYAETGVLYVMIATILGARLGHILFYEHPMEYLKNPLSILKTWEGGLASHGAIIAIIISLFLFYRKSKEQYPEFSFLRLVDTASISVMFVAGMIRIGNFFNQEILGVHTLKPWGIIFKHPADGSPPLPRHPAQLYESAFYFGIFFFVFYLWKRFNWTLKPGRICGIAIGGSFLFRFFIEYVKTEQSLIIGNFHTSLLMGQLLSIPLVTIGIILFFAKQREKIEA